MDCHYALVIYVCLPTGLSDIHRGEYLSLASCYQLEEGQLVCQECLAYHPVDGEEGKM